MKKFIILVLIIAAAYWGYTFFGPNLVGTDGFDAQGNPKVLLFTMDGCGPSADVAGDLRSRNVTFEEVSLSTDEGRRRIGKFGATQVPLTVIGKRTVLGNDLLALESTLAEVLCPGVLTPAVQQVMSNHFDAQGKPKIVLYGTMTCPYCNRMKAYLGGRKIAYQFVDVSGMGRDSTDFAVLRGVGYPLIFVGYRRIDGYDEAKVDQAVKDLL